MGRRALRVPWAIVALCALVVGCGAPAAAPTAEVVAPPAWAEGGRTQPEVASTRGGGIACGGTRCDSERPHCCSPMGEVLDTAEPRPEPYCVVDYTQCLGVGQE